MTTSHRSPAPGLTSFAIYEDSEAQDLMSPTEMFEGDVSFSSEHSLQPDEVIPSIELDDDNLADAPQPYRSSYTSRRSSLKPRRSSGIYSVVSAIPSESSISSKPVAPPPASDTSEHRYTPRKDRPRFRNPESVRAMQMSSPPLLPTVETSRERLKGSYKLMTPSRSGRSETPVSKKSGSRRGSVREHQSPMPTPTPQQAPLVLLHVTILPPQVPYSHDLMVRIMPEWLVENYKLLDEKLQDIILMRRGLLIPHPRDEYDVLEERILESLELKTPRLLKCGHFVPPEDDTDHGESDDEASVLDDSTGRGSRMSGGTFTEERENSHHARSDSMCNDCHHELKRPRQGVGAGRRRWDIKIYAANGLMRANAWAACWGEMERCDVEIQPWIPDDLRKTLEQRVVEEQEAEKRKHMYAVELQRQIQESTSKQKIAEEEAAERKRLEEVELQKSFEAAAAALQRSIEDKAAEKKKFEEAIQVKIEEAKESMRLETEARAEAEVALLAERLRLLEGALAAKSTATDTSVQPPPIRAAQIPLSTLLKNYVLVLLKDQRNFIILVLSALVVYLAMNMASAPLPQVASIAAESSYVVREEPVTVSYTSTMIETVFEVAPTSTVTQYETAWVTEAATVTMSVITESAAESSAALKMDDLGRDAIASTEVEDTQPKLEVPQEQDSSTPFIEEVSASAITTANEFEAAVDAPAPFQIPQTHGVCLAESLFASSSAQCVA
ncbi:hypothetical protein DE146DRAFT_649229 [Phaeosphaeria sp. MPI-PUGE-AT-0046c]|nr:hypothetical protein DE146DRAFT_649229 [Phaeosphaeria sp. MPI-PUGE-AT-0046c]